MLIAGSLVSVASRTARCRDGKGWPEALAVLKATRSRVRKRGLINFLDTPPPALQAVRKKALEVLVRRAVIDAHSRERDLN
jgi:hypothetical protein